jgi:hypothetical protein
LENHDNSIKNNGAIVSIEKRDFALTQFISRVDNLEDVTKRMSELFSGNSSKLQHKLFDDITDKYVGTMSAKDFILNSMKLTSVDKKKKDRSLSLE